MRHGADCARDEAPVRKPTFLIFSLSQKFIKFKLIEWLIHPVFISFETVQGPLWQGTTVALVGTKRVHYTARDIRRFALDLR